jgi:HK97 family phage prohead protease
VEKMENKRDAGDILTRQSPTEFRVRSDGDERYIEGYFVRFGDVYDMGYGITESIRAGAFDEVLASGADIRVLINHDSTLVLGRTKAGTATFRADAVGVWGSVRINPKDQDAVNALARVERGDVDQASFGFRDWEEEKSSDPATGHVHYTLTKIKELREFTVCTFPAYQSTSLAARDADNNKRRHNAWIQKRKEKFAKWH